ncbi:preprotein translocase subunit SecG [Alcanivorax sp. S6407]|uniref:preprotein translocase subunit SecG n=1 Tax=Alcanivorax sp. S6407 TaxID=2926424 RepID=UPI001FF527EB|nr:preprotein translocase subunit SecG [Alcanivorax sp. S6407]MCK0155357.1 preprotein translocase subunit SecG [Alcanivorax sp. S6407]
MDIVVHVVHILTALGLIGLVLIQHGKGADAGASFGGGASQSVFGSAGSANFLTRATAILAVLFFVTSLILAWMARQEANGATNYLPELETIEEQADVPVPADQAEVPAVQSEVPVAAEATNSEKEVSEVPQADVESASPVEVPQPEQQ